jgi:lipoprotein-releasing system permease protein
VNHDGPKLLFLQINTEILLNLEFFIARRIIGDREKRKTISRSIIGIAMFSISLGLAVMIIAMAVVTGFKKEISSKVVGFGAHIQIVNFDSNISFETQPVKKTQEFLPDLKNEPGITNVQVFATKAGIVKTKTDIQGVVLKGVGSDYDWGPFQNYIVEGEPFAVSDTAVTNKVLISRTIASLLKLNIGDEFLMFFIQDPPRVRRFKISGIYETSLVEFDRIYIFGDIAHIQKLNNWSDDQVSGFEVMTDDIGQIEEMTWRVSNIVGYGFEEDGSKLRVINILQKFPQIFDWLSLQDMNVIIILLLMLVVAGFNMISGLLIIILDRMNMIGVLKALGATNQSIRLIFMYQSAYLILKGLFWGNIIGLSLCLLQQQLGIMKLDPSSYYLTTVPVNLDIWHILSLNAGTGILVLLILVIPSALISRITPVKVLRFT